MFQVVNRCLSLAILLGGSAAAADEEPAAASPLMLETVVVSGVQPGPGLWKVSRDGHVLWVLGTLQPLPKRMEWESREVEATIAQSQEVLLSPSVELDADVGMIGGLFLLPSLLKARNNPEEATLQQVLPAELYARWSALKAKYIGRNRAVEKRRPIFAAQELYGRAISRSGLAHKDVVTPVVRRAAKRGRITVITPEVTVKLAEPRAAVKQFRKASLDDIACLEKTMSRLEADLETMVLRANAWATGDLALLRELEYVDQNQACADAFLRSQVVQDRGFDDLEARVERAWLEAAEAAMSRNTTSFAILPLRLIGDGGGYLEKLRARGYRVEEPPPR